MIRRNDGEVTTAKERGRVIRITNDKPIMSREGGVLFCSLFQAVSPGGEK